MRATGRMGNRTAFTVIEVYDWSCTHEASLKAHEFVERSASPIATASD